VHKKILKKSIKKRLGGAHVVIGGAELSEYSLTKTISFATFSILIHTN
jgi:hypothetical protein